LISTVVTPPGSSACSRRRALPISSDADAARVFATVEAIPPPAPAISS